MKTTLLAIIIAFSFATGKRNVEEVGQHSNRQDRTVVSQRVTGEKKPPVFSRGWMELNLIY